jgi:hypothetical protein
MSLSHSRRSFCANRARTSACAHAREKIGAETTLRETCNYTFGSDTDSVSLSHLRWPEPSIQKEARRQLGQLPVHNETRDKKGKSDGGKRSKCDKGERDNGLSSQKRAGRSDGHRERSQFPVCAGHRTNTEWIAVCYTHFGQERWSRPLFEQAHPLGRHRALAFCVSTKVRYLQRRIARGKHPVAQRSRERHDQQGECVGVEGGSQKPTTIRRAPSTQYLLSRQGTLRQCLSSKILLFVKQRDDGDLISLLNLRFFPCHLHLPLLFPLLFPLFSSSRSLRSTDVSGFGLALSSRH